MVSVEAYSRSFARQHLSPTGLVVLHLELALKKPLLINMDFPMWV